MVASKRNRPTIGVLTGWQVFTGIIDSFLEHVIRGIQAAANERGCNLLLACGASTAISFDVGRPAWPILHERIDFLPVGPWNCDGLIITPTISVKACEQYAVELGASGFPIIYAGLQGLGPGVGPDNEMGIRQAMRHLVAHGHRRIAFIAGFDFDEKGDSGNRLKIYREALEELGILYDPDLVAYGSHELVRGQQAMQQILARKAPFSALLGSNDLSAMGAIDVLRKAGYQVPQDVAVIGFDNRIETRAHVPPLTTIHFPMFELGYQSFEMVLDHLEGKVGPHEVRLIPTQLVIRESCGCPPGETGKINRLVRDLYSTKNAPHHIEPKPELSAAGQPVSTPLEPGEIEQEISSIIQTESHRTRRGDVLLLTQRCVEAFRESLTSGNAQSFLSVFQEVLDQVSAWQDDLYTWQYAITVLRESQTLVPAPNLTREAIENMLDQARVMVSETTRAQSTRQLIRQAQVAELLEVMTSTFFAAQDEDEIFSTLSQSLPAIGIEQTAVCYFQPKGDDPVAWSVLQSPHPSLAKGYPFDTYQFPPPELFPAQQPLQLALLSLWIGRKPTGYIALKIGPLEPLADIVRQLGSSLYAVRLRQEALEGQRMAEEANRLKSRFLSMVSHELRAPLNLISGLSDIILKGKNANRANDSSWEDLERIYISAQHLDGLIQDVLDLARSDIGQLKLTCEPLNLKDVLDSVAAICKSLVSDKGLVWRYEVAGDIPQVWGDRTRLRQVTLNLVNNAIKFTDRGEVVLMAALTAQGQVAITVSDTGLGIPPGEQDIIFQEFRQSERTAARGYGGLGLGLAICKRLVEMHGGEITVYSTGRKDRGAIFTFTLPPLETQALPLPKPVKPEQSACVFGLVKDLASSKVLQNYLLEQGHEVELHTIGDENEWLSWLLAANPDVVVMDLGITSERGWEVLKTMKENPATQEIPVLFYTVSNDEQGGSLLELDYLTKPVKSTALAESLLNYQVADLCSGREPAPLILVVDDDASTVDLHTRLVRTQFPNARILQAFNGRTALDIIRQEPPTLVLLDLLMPEMDGFTVLAEMRENKNSRDVPVIVITSQSLDQHDIARLNRGMVSILGKSIFSKEETLEHISAFLQNRRKQGSEAQQAILKAMAFIHTSYKEPIARSDIAASVGLSERHLDRCFQQGLGISPITYLNRYRVYQARNLLDTQNMGITAVAMEVGFSSSGYFARVFRDEMGLSPRMYLQNKSGASPQE
jgi:signal transduction histidine kinase/DNA-binding LacI/PurR family transcriptional regulator/CheY-like chemotaxis protein